MLLQNRVVDVESPSGPTRVSIVRQSIHMRMLNAPDETTYVRDIGGAVKRGEEEPDLELTLGLLGQRLVLYWRETFQHRMYRQGLFSIEGHELKPLCEGRGGVYISH